MKRKLLLATLLIIGAKTPGVWGMTLREYELGWARYYARADHVPEALVEAIIIVESGGNPYAVSSKGAAGVMQLMPATAYEFRVRNRFLIQDNIRAGTAYLALLMREFHGDLRLVVAAYHAGDGRIARQKLACSSPEIYNYVRRVAAVYRALEANRR
ncbi:MAG TPA: lytic transglycosylase domain-containing protein [Terriglobia bacterium]|nr:lytic transglycosylase domain-containing protein [Terriglobia bacterium]